jgi:hypothetical protein
LTAHRFIPHPRWPKPTRNTPWFKIGFDAGRSVCEQNRDSNLQRYASVLWKDADPDIPILKEAKGEYAKLQ